MVGSKQDSGLFFTLPKWDDPAIHPWMTSMEDAMAASHTVSDKMSAGGRAEDEPGLVSRLGPVEIDWPRSMGYFGGIALAVGLEIIDPPLAIFIAAIPFIKMLNGSGLPTPTRFVAQMLEGLSKPVGGDTQGTIRLVSPAEGTSGEPVD